MKVLMVFFGDSKIKFRGANFQEKKYPFSFRDIFLGHVPKKVIRDIFLGHDQPQTDSDRDVNLLVCTQKFKLIWQYSKYYVATTLPGQTSYHSTSISISISLNHPLPCYIYHSGGPMNISCRNPDWSFIPPYSLHFILPSLQTHSFSPFLLSAHPYPFISSTTCRSYHPVVWRWH